jgi:hypothetical protein
LNHKKKNGRKHGKRRRRRRLGIAVGKAALGEKSKCTLLCNKIESAQNQSEPIRTARFTRNQITTPRFARNQSPALRAFRTALRAYSIKDALRAQAAYQRNLLFVSFARS